MEKSAVIFDLDGTLTRPYLDFDAIRAEIGDVDGPILEAMEAMNGSQRRRAEQILLRHEQEAAANATIYDGAVEVLDECRRRGYPLAILTRNTRANVDLITSTHGLHVDLVRTRDDGVIKPSGEPVLAICQALSADPRESWMVGDFLFDIQSGRSAGTRTVLMAGEDTLPPFADQADFVIRALRELLSVLDSDRG